MKRVIAAVQSRMGSTRLPGKALRLVAGQPLVLRVLQRAKLANGLAEVVLATTTSPEDDVLAAAVEEAGFGVYRGPVDDLAARYWGVAQAFDADAVVRIWGDCPFIDPDTLRAAIVQLRDRDLAYVATYTPDLRTFPAGMDFEIFTRNVLADLACHTEDPFLREYPCEYVQRHGHRYRTATVSCEEDWSSVHLTVDYEVDLELADHLYRSLGTSSFSLQDVVRAYHASGQLRNQVQALARNQEYLEKKARQ